MRLIRLAVVLSIILVPLAVDAQPAGKVYRLGRLYLGAPQDSERIYLIDALRDLGWIEGRNLEVEFRSAQGRAERLPALVAELVRRGVDVLVVGGSGSVRAAQQATKTIPIVMILATDPIAVGLVPSLARPGGNVTGVVLGAELAGKRLELLREAVPHAARIALLVRDIGDGPQVKQAEQAAGQLGIRLVVVEAKRREYEEAFAAMKRQHPDALLVGASPVLNADRRQIIELAARHRLPAIYQWEEHAEDGGLLAYGTNLRKVNRRVATYVDRIFRGARPADLPVEQVTEVTLAVNLRTAKALGLTIPQSILLRADQVIE